VAKIMAAAMAADPPLDREEFSRWREESGHALESARIEFVDRASEGTGG
jgi:hypothetical protein